MSKPITEEQRPEREAMKMRAQQERENAAKYTFLGKVQAFVERGKEMERADFYGYVTVSAPSATLTWLLPSASGTSFQPLMGSAYLYQHSGTIMLTGVTGQSQISTSAASYSCGLEWVITGSTEEKSSSLGDFTMTVTEQDTAMSMATQYGNTSDANNMVPLYPSLSASLVQGTPSHIANQGHRLSFLYQQGSQVGYYDQGTLGPLLSGELGACLQSYGSASSYMGSRASAPQPEMVTALKEVQPADTLPPGSTSGTYYSASAQTITQPRFQAMETSLSLQPPGQTFCLPHPPEFPKTCSSRNLHTLESNPPPEVGGTSVTASVQSSRNPLARPPAKDEEQTEKNSLGDIKTKLSKPLDASQTPTENQDDTLLPFQIPDIHQLLACIDPLGQEKQPGSENTHPGKNSLSLQDQGTLGHETESSGGFADKHCCPGGGESPSSALQFLERP
ncbi:hypothetical protein MC885_015834 [Smutsia gigantea]|nr:hypothetical protein MC885_015834 [Smutsia gigantea]